MSHENTAAGAGRWDALLSESVLPDIPARSGLIDFLPAVCWIVVVVAAVALIALEKSTRYRALTAFLGIDTVALFQSKKGAAEFAKRHPGFKDAADWYRRDDVRGWLEYITPRSLLPRTPMHVWVTRAGSVLVLGIMVVLAVTATNQSVRSANDREAAASAWSADAAGWAAEVKDLDLVEPVIIGNDEQTFGLYVGSDESYQIAEFEKISGAWTITTSEADPAAWERHSDDGSAFLNADAPSAGPLLLTLVAGLATLGVGIGAFFVRGRRAGSDPVMVMAAARRRAFEKRDFDAVVELDVDLYKARTTLKSHPRSLGGKIMAGALALIAVVLGIVTVAAGSATGAANIEAGERKERRAETAIAGVIERYDLDAGTELLGRSKDGLLTDTVDYRGLPGGAWCSEAFINGCAESQVVRDGTVIDVLIVDVDDQLLLLDPRTRRGIER